MRYLIFSFITCFCLAANLTASSFELKLNELFPRQSIFKSLIIEAEDLESEIYLTNGILFDHSLDFPSLSEIKEITLKGPEVHFHLISQDDNEWVRTIQSFYLNILNDNQECTREVHLEFKGNALPLTLANDQEFKNIPFHFGQHLAKTLISNTSGEVFLQLRASYNDEDNTHSDISFEYGAGKQVLRLELLESSEEKQGSWEIRSRLLGKGVLVDLLVSGLKKMCETSKQMNFHHESVQKFFTNAGFFLDRLSPLCDWAGIDFISFGDFELIEKTNDSISLTVNNNFRLEAYEGKWNSEIGSKTFLSKNEDSNAQWSQEIIIRNPSEDLAKISNWLQLNCLDEMAAFLNMPSISYYGKYFPTYLSDTLVSILTNLGTPQENGTLLFSISGNLE